MFHGPTSGIHPFVILCKRCQQNIPAPVQTLPDSWIVASARSAARSAVICLWTFFGDGYPSTC
jgi:hypothetical protein